MVPRQELLLYSPGIPILLDQWPAVAALPQMFSEATGDLHSCFRFFFPFAFCVSPKMGAADIVRLQEAFDVFSLHWSCFSMAAPKRLYIYIYACAHAYVRGINVPCFLCLSKDGRCRYSESNGACDVLAHYIECIWHWNTAFI